MFTESHLESYIAARAIHDQAKLTSIALALGHFRDFSEGILMQDPNGLMHRCNLQNLEHFESAWDARYMENGGANDLPKSAPPKVVTKSKGGDLPSPISPRKRKRSQVSRAPESPETLSTPPIEDSSKPASKRVKVYKRAGATKRRTAHQPDGTGIRPTDHHSSFIR